MNEIPRTPSEEKLAAALRNLPAVWTPECPEPTAWLDWIERGDAFPDAARLAKHLFSCGYCWEEYDGLRETLALGREIAAEQEGKQSAKPEVMPAPPMATPAPTERKRFRWPAFFPARPLPLAFAVAALLLLLSGVKIVMLERQAAAPKPEMAAALEKKVLELQQENDRQAAEFQRLKEVNAELSRNKQALIAALKQKNSEKNKTPPPQFGPRKYGNTEIAAGNAEHFQLADAARATLLKLGEQTTRGGGDEDALISPKAQIVEQEKPEFHWQKFKNADKYLLTLMDNDSEKIFAIKTDKTTFGASEWQRQKPLLRGKIYSWSLKAYDKGENPVQANGAPGSKNSDETDAKAQFAVLNAATFQKLARNRQNTKALVVLYANAGMFDQAEAEIKRFEAQNHNSPLPKQWRRQIERLRQKAQAQ